MTDQRRQTGAEAMLGALADCGVRWLFANAGTDFPPVIEALAQLGEDAPEPVTIPHETAAVAMAHGVWLVTGAAQAVMVHVNVGLANAAMGVINAASDDVPVIVMSGRTPITETGRVGSRVTPIQYGQEMYDQSSIVRDAVRFSYEMRYPGAGRRAGEAGACDRDGGAGRAGLSEPAARAAGRGGAGGVRARAGRGRAVAGDAGPGGAGAAGGVAGRGGAAGDPVPEGRRGGAAGAGAVGAGAAVRHRRGGAVFGAECDGVGGSGADRL